MTVAADGLQERLTFVAFSIEVVAFGCVVAEEFSKIVDPNF